MHQARFSHRINPFFRALLLLTSFRDITKSPETDEWSSLSPNDWFINRLNGAGQWRYWPRKGTSWLQMPHAHARHSRASSQNEAVSSPTSHKETVSLLNEHNFKKQHYKLITLKTTFRTLKSIICVLVIVKSKIGQPN